MAVLAECPNSLCKRKQSLRNRICKGCGQDLAKAKKSGRVRYWINTDLPGGRQRREFVGYSLEEARAADGKRRAQKKEGRFFELLPEIRITFNELKEWYLEFPGLDRLSSYGRIRSCLDNFNAVFGNYIVGDMKAVDVVRYQQKRSAAGKAARTIDYEISVVKTMLKRAWENDKVSGAPLKSFMSVKSVLKKGSNVRERTLTTAEYLKLTTGKYKNKQGKMKPISPPHLKPILIVAYHTGMRSGELRALKLSHFDRKAKMIRLPASVTKEKRAKNIPLNRYVLEALESLPRALHHDYVFTYNGRPIKSPGGLKKSFRSACDNAGIPCGQKVSGGLIFHDLRRTFKTNMARAGVSKTHRDAILGHSSQDMDRHYIHLEDTDLHEAIEKYTAWYENQVKEIKSGSRKGQEIPIS